MDQVFEQVWFLPCVNTWSIGNLLAYHDKGSLAVRDCAISFKGTKDQLDISNIRRVSYVMQGRDFVNHWVRIDYEKDGLAHVALFADGGLLGWRGLLGGTKRIFRFVRPLASPQA